MSPVVPWSVPPGSTGVSDGSGCDEVPGFDGSWLVCGFEGDWTGSLLSLTDGLNEGEGGGT